MRYGAAILKWRTDELNNMDLISMEIKKMHCSLSDIDRLYLTKEKGGRGLIRCEGCVRSEEKSNVES